MDLATQGCALAIVMICVALTLRVSLSFAVAAYGKDAAHLNIESARMFPG